MLSVLERKERVVEAEINILEYQEANREFIALVNRCTRHPHPACFPPNLLVAVGSSRMISCSHFRQL
jgi:hypothetical protein